MVRIQDTTLWRRATNTAGKRALVGVGIATLAILIGWSLLEYSHEQRVNALENEAKTAWQESTKPAGGAEKDSHVQCAHWIDTVGMPDTNCPQVVQSGSVLVSSGAERDFMTMVIQKLGYSSGTFTTADKEDYYGGTKGKFIMELSLFPLSGMPPYSAPTGNEWKSLSIQVYERN